MGFDFDVGNAINGAIGLYTSIHNMRLQDKWAKKNYELQKQAQDESMFMNRNQFQVQSADALKAGISPLAMSGGQVSSASAQNVDAPQLDTSQLSNVLGTVLNFKHDEKMQEKAQKFTADENEKKRKHEELIEELKIGAENKRHSESLAQDEKHFSSQLDELRNYHKQLKEISDSQIDVQRKKNEIDKLRYEMENTAQDSLLKLRDMQSKLTHTELLTKAKELANLFATGEKNHQSNSLIAIAKRFGMELSGSSKSESSWYDAILKYLGERDEK